MPVFIALFLIITLPCSFNLNLKFLVYLVKIEYSNKLEFKLNNEWSVKFIPSITRKYVALYKYNIEFLYNFLIFMLSFELAKSQNSQKSSNSLNLYIKEEALNMLEVFFIVKIFLCSLLTFISVSMYFVIVKIKISSFSLEASINNL